VSQNFNTSTQTLHKLFIPLDFYENSSKLRDIPIHVRYITVQVQHIASRWLAVLQTTVVRNHCATLPGTTIWNCVATEGASVCAGGHVSDVGVWISCCTNYKQILDQHHTRDASDAWGYICGSKGGHTGCMGMEAHFPFLQQTAAP